MFDSLFNMYKIKYVDLKELIIGNCKELKSNSTINVFINLEMIIRKMTNPNILNYMNTSKVDKYKDVIAQVINLIAHYRKFFTGNRHKNNIYLYMGYPFNNNYDNTDILSTYRNSYCNKFTKETNVGYLTITLNNSIPIIRDICEYIQGVNIVYSNSIEPSLIPYTIYDKFNKADVNLILTNDIYDFQYVNIDSFYCIRIGKGYHYIVNKDNCIERLKMEEKIYNSNLNKVTSNQLSFVLSLIGNKKRDIPKIPKIGLSTALKLIQEGIDKNIISQDTSNFNILCELIPSAIIDKVAGNYLVTDIFNQYNNHSNGYFKYVRDFIIDRFDNASLRELSDKYFIETPLMVEELNNFNYKKEW